VSAAADRTAAVALQQAEKSAVGDDSSEEGDADHDDPLADVDNEEELDIEVGKVHTKQYNITLAQGFYLARGCIRRTTLDLLFRLANKWDSCFRGIHGKEKKGEEGWTISNLLVYATEAHKIERGIHEAGKDVLMQNKDFQREANICYEAFLVDVRVGARQAGIPFTGLAEMELVQSMSEAEGQEWHMDMLKGSWALTAPYMGNPLAVPITGLATYPTGYTDYPDNLRQEANIPRDWRAFEQVDLKWNIGDLLFFRTNYIHKGPPNPSLYSRGVVFGNLISTHNTYTDEKVIMNAYFNNIRTG
jgi:hypothetical protein